MTRIRILAAATLTTLAFSTGALAQDPMMMKDNGAMTVMPNGEMMIMETVDPAMMEMAMKNAQPVSAGTIFFMNDGKLYMMQDMKMEDGKMMSEGMMMQQ